MSHKMHIRTMGVDRAAPSRSDSRQSWMARKCWRPEGAVDPSNDAVPRFGLLVRDRWGLPAVGLRSADLDAIDVLITHTLICASDPARRGASEWNAYSGTSSSVHGALLLRRVQPVGVLDRLPMRWRGSRSVHVFMEAGAPGMEASVHRVTRVLSMPAWRRKLGESSHVETAADKLSVLVT